MAEGYSRISENIGVLYVTTGPGGTNAVTGVVDAWIDSIPMLVISGQAKRSQNVYNSGIPGLRQLGGQEVNILPIVDSFTKYSAMVNDPQLIKYHLDKAVYCAKHGRPGPSWLDIPLDVQAIHVNEGDLVPFVVDHKKAPSIDSKIVDKVHALLTEANRPLIIAGNGVRLSGSARIFLQFVHALKIPVVVSKLGLDLIGYEEPYFVGFGGTKGTRAANFAIQNADLILSLGSRLANPFIGYEHDLFARGAKKIIVDIDSSELKKFQFDVEVALECDVHTFITDLCAAVRQKPLPEKPNWIKTVTKWKKRYQAIHENHEVNSEYINLYSFFDSLYRVMDSSSIVIGDAGSVYYVISQASRVKQGQRVIVPAGLGTMGLSLPLGIGAFYASKDVTVIAVTGDGSLQMNIQELQTVFHNQIPLKLFVISNGGYLTIKHTQENFFSSRFIGAGPDSGVSFPDLCDIAKAYKIPYASITVKDDLQKAIKEVIHSDTAVLCEVFTDPNQKIIPSVTSTITEDGQMISMPLEDMAPFLERGEFFREMIIEPMGDDKQDEHGIR
jgi:acetolactate synthase-1/2/3 large subunit